MEYLFCKGKLYGMIEDGKITSCNVQRVLSISSLALHDFYTVSYLFEESFKDEGRGVLELSVTISSFFRHRRQQYVNSSIR